MESILRRVKEKKRNSRRNEKGALELLTESHVYCSGPEVKKNEVEEDPEQLPLVFSGALLFPCLM
jgi:hypothetical protein